MAPSGAPAASAAAASVRAASTPHSRAIQVIERPNIPLIEEFMRSDKTDVILATGGTAMVRSAYSSSNPAIGVGPGNAPVLVDATADLAVAARFITDSKSFDNSVLCTSESVLITVVEVEKELTRELAKAGCHICSPEETELVRGYLFHERGFNVEALGRDAPWIAQQAGFKVPPKTRVLVTPVTLIGVDEPLTREKLCPVLAMFTARGRVQALAMSRAVLRFSGAGHSAAIHSRDPQTVMDFSTTVEAYRVVVNAPCSTGASGFETHLPPTFTIGTGYYGRSSIGDNIGPQHLVHWTQVAYHKDSAEAVTRLEDVERRFAGPLPEAPSDGVPGKSFAALRAEDAAIRHASGSDLSGAQLREEIRRIIAEELRQALKG
jgi:acyl-CoA reductase-like NAD-dependent aldehyde dehydrogenase